MDEHPNAAKLRDGYESFARADLDAVRALLADDIVWHFPGTSPLAGDYKGHEAVFGFFMRVFEETGGTFKIEVRDVLANDVHSIAIVHVSGERNGASLDQDQVHIAHINADGRATEFWNMAADVTAIDAFWS